MYRYVHRYWIWTVLHRGRAERLPKYERGLTIGVNPSTEMSVKAFMEKYFHTTASPSPSMSFPSKIQSVEPTQPSQPSQSKKEIFHIFTDGACSDNGRRGARGGFGVYFYSDRQTPNLDISEPLMNNEQQTNNRAELRAIQAALDGIENHAAQWLPCHELFYVWSDSEYCINSLTKWAPGWKRNGWKKGDGGLIQNLDLIKPIHIKLSSMPYVFLRHVRGHQDSKKTEFPWCGNHEADRLATSSLQKRF